VCPPIFVFPDEACRDRRAIIESVRAKAAHRPGAVAEFGRNYEIFRRYPAVLEERDAECFAGHHFLTLDIRGFNNRGIEQFGDELEFELLLARESDA
jgi:hypothetical protein